MFIFIECFNYVNCSIIHHVYNSNVYIIMKITTACSCIVADFLLHYDQAVPGCRLIVVFRASRVKPPTRLHLIYPTFRVHLRCCCSQCHSSCHCCRFHCRRCCCCCHSPSHEGTRAQPIRVYEGTTQATRTQSESARVQLKPQGHSPSLRGRSPNHKGSACPSL
jgi:hypothetical protein